MTTRILYIDCFSGVAGDMMLGALVDLGLPKDYLETNLRTLDLPHWELEAQRCTRQGLGGVDVRVRYPVHTEHKHGRTWHSIRSMIESSGLKEGAKTTACKIFERLANAEAHIHGVNVADVHFHEVGAVDAIVDICGTAIGLDWLDVDKIVSAPVPTPRGWVTAEHGLLPLPAPATIACLEGCEILETEETGEWVTPTGAAILSTIATQFGSMPSMTVDAVGYGAGDRDPASRPNLLRLVLGSTADSTADHEVKIEANIDDMSPELVAYLMQRLFDAGANDVWLTPIQMKKGRPGTQLSVLTTLQTRSQLIDVILQESTTIGVRIVPIERHRMERRIETVDTPWGPVRIKIALDGDRIVNRAPEYDDCQHIAQKHRVPLKEVFHVVNAAITNSTT